MEGTEKFKSFICREIPANERYGSPKGELLAENIRELELHYTNAELVTIQVHARRRRVSDLPIRGISREWAKTRFSVPSVALW
jgi:hypothetical protein